MMNQKGFIATSLIYSFFLVFIAVMAAILNNYIANKTILDRFNEEVMDNLNEKTYSVKVYSENGQIEGGKNFTNLVQNGNSMTSAPWVKTNTIYRQAFTIPIENGTFYYITLKNSNNHNSNFKYSLGGISSQYLSIIKAQKHSNIIQTTNNSDLTIETSVPSYFTNIMVIKLAGIFENTPNIQWMDENIDYFEGTRSYLKKMDITEGGTAEFSFQLNNPAHNAISLDCKDKNNISISSANRQISVKDGKKKLTIKNIKSDITCNVRWG